jgi:hypothetical protein
VQECKVTFGVVYLDRLNNTNNGVRQKDVKDVEKKPSKLGDLCYAADKKPDLICFIHTTPGCLPRDARLYGQFNVSRGGDRRQRQRSSSGCRFQFYNDCCALHGGLLGVHPGH